MLNIKKNGMKASTYISTEKAPPIIGAHCSMPFTIGSVALKNCNMPAPKRARQSASQHKPNPNQEQGYLYIKLP
jgi:hypothetical protein